ncbi:MAG: hypothetical protein LBJ00_12015 [Planctomycetaceae bacterium]|nr:hypothetical protein [Planctomycetaceae bacterium]
MKKPIADSVNVLLNFNDHEKFSDLIEFPVITGCGLCFAEATLNFLKLNPQAQQREAVVQGRSLSPIPATIFLGFC